MKLDLYQYLVKGAKAGLTMQRSEGWFPEGHNGPWRNKSTPGRSTAHWALLLYKAYAVTGDKTFLDAAIKACDYLASKKNRPFGYSFYCHRGNTIINRCNGLIGQAWAVEPLVFIGHKSNKKEYRDIARYVLTLHRYSFAQHAWAAVEIDGKELGIARTLNQQVWFSAMALILGKYLEDDYLLKRSHDFFTHISSRIEFLESGLINHFIRVRREEKIWLNDWRLVIRSLLKRGIKKVADIYLQWKIHVLSLGYLTFILYGFALAYRYCYDEPFWQDSEFKKILLTSIQYIEHHFPYGYLGKGGFSWSYNPVGIEMAYVLETFNDLLNLNSSPQGITKWLQRQFEGYYDFKVDLLCKNTSDPRILAARLYEATRLKNYTLEI